MMKETLEAPRIPANPRSTTPAAEIPEPVPARMLNEYAYCPGWPTWNGCRENSRTA